MIYRWMFHDFPWSHPWSQPAIGHPRDRKAQRSAPWLFNQGCVQTLKISRSCASRNLALQSFWIIYIPCTGDEAVLAIRPCFRVTAIVRFQSTAFCSKGSLLFLVKFTHTPFTPNESHPFPFPARLSSKPSCWNPNEVKSSNKNYNFSFGNTCWYQMHVENNTLDQQVLITLHRHPCLAGRCQLVANKI